MWITSLIMALIYTQITANPRIIGGQFASPGQFPHQISLQLKGRHHCGGSLISELIVITAAHCTVDQTPTQMRVVAGTTDLDSLTNDAKVIGVLKFTIHPQYNPHNQDYDLSLIKLSEPMPFSNNIQPIQMADSETNYPADTLAIISGFGAINGNLDLPNRLKYATVQLWSRDYCNAQNIPGITDRMICAGHPSGQISSCQGDSGGPLTVQNKLFGVVSWGFGCGTRGRPAMYSHIGAMRSWIKKNADV